MSSISHHSLRSVYIDKIQKWCTLHATVAPQLFAMRTSHSVHNVFDQIMDRKGLFLGVFFMIMLVSYGALYAIDFIPEPITEEVVTTTATASTAADDDVTRVQETNGVVGDNSSDTAPNPVSIHIDALDRTVAVLNPQSRAVADLDAALLDGVVRHPDSADFHETGNIFILGHSSYLPTVFNKNFQAFNGIQNLTWGDTIRLRSADTEYVYRVERVYEAKASEVTVPNSRGEAKLTLATCDTFGAKEDRFIVEASLVTSRSL